MSYENIPLDMQQRAQWVCWRFEETDDPLNPKPTKVPYSPHNGAKASVTKPQSWGTFEQVQEMAELAHFDGIGFVLTTGDPYAFIDLDHTDDADAQARQVAVQQAFNSYAEISPSGNGLHIIVQGHVPQGRKRSYIEVYSEKRFMTMTGNVYNAAPIYEYNELLNILWAEMAPPNIGASNTGHNDAQYLEDGAIYDRAALAANGEKFIDLFAGNWEQYYSSQSEADFALINIIAFYTQNREQIERMFKVSALGARDKQTTIRGVPYLEHMINRAFDRIMPPINIDAIREQIAALVNQKPRDVSEPPIDSPKAADDDHVPLPPGLLGEIAQYIYAAAPRPIEKVALGGAIGLMAGICGRAYNVSGTGLNHYVLVLGKTGVGKEALSLIDKLMSRVGDISDEGGKVPAATEFIGPSEIASPQALQKYLAKRSKSFVSITGEIGLKLKTMLDPRAPAHLTGLRRALLMLYSKSGQSQALGSLVYSDSANDSQAIYAPAFSMLGETTPERLFDHLTEEMISEGLMPRFNVIEYRGKRPPRNKEHTAVQPAHSLIQKLAQLCGHALLLNSADEVVNVEFTDEARVMLDKFDVYCDAKINNGTADVQLQFWNRAHLKTMKLAALVAVGINPYAPVIDHSIAAWALDFVTNDIRNMLVHFDNGDMGPDNSERLQIAAIKDVIRDYFSADWESVKSYGGTPMTHDQGVIPYSVLSRRVLSLAPFKKDRAGATNALKRSIQTMVDTGALIALGPQELAQMAQNGWIKPTNAKYYRLVDAEA